MFSRSMTCVGSNVSVVEVPLDEEGWLRATHSITGVCGLLPANHVELIEGTLVELDC